MICHCTVPGGTLTKNLSHSQCGPILLSQSRGNMKKVQFTSPCLSMVPLASVVWANSSSSPFMCKGTKGENNTCIFHCNPYNIWGGSVARQGFGELFPCLGLNNKLLLQEQCLLVSLCWTISDTPGAACRWKTLYNQILRLSEGFMNHLQNSVNLTVLLISFWWFHCKLHMQNNCELSSS